MKTIFIWILLVAFAIANKDHERAETRARLANAKSLQEALRILKTSNKNGPIAMLSADALEKEEQKILKTAQELGDGLNQTVEPRNGGCEPRVVCKPVFADRITSGNVMPFPQCIEVHQCGGCCQETQFSCVPVQQDPVTFSPLVLMSLDDDGQHKVQPPLTLMNHTQCECKCGIAPEKCRQEGKILDHTLCQCVQPHCTPECLLSSKCSVVKGSSIPRCTCRRRLNGQKSNYCENPDARPNTMCRDCELANG